MDHEREIYLRCATCATYTARLQVVTFKTKELVVDFRKRPTHPKPVGIRGTEVDIVEEYKYLGVHIDNKMDWTKNTKALYKKGQSPVFSTETQIFQRLIYCSVVASVIFYAVVCWGSRVKAADAKRLNKLIRKAVYVLGVELESLVEVPERRMLSNLLSIMDNASHPLHATLKSYQSTFSHRLRLPRCTTECHQLYNSSPFCGMDSLNIRH